MAIDTKPNFSNNKFEQCAGDIMNLSGCTQIFGIFDIETGATLTICENAADGKVLTSNASGIATWETLDVPSQGVTSVSGSSGMDFTTITTIGGIILGTPSTILNTSTDISSGTTHHHSFSANTFVTGSQGILVDGSNRFYLDDIYISDSILPNLHTIDNVTSNQTLGSLPTGQTLGMVYITNTGSTQAIVNLGTTSLGNDITPYQPITVDAGEDVSITVNMRLSIVDDTPIYINSDSWTNVALNVEWANITFKNVPLPTGSTGVSLWETGIAGGIAPVDSNGIIEVEKITNKNTSSTLCIGGTNTSRICIDKPLHFTGLGTKTTETCGLYVDSNGIITTGLAGGGGLPALTDSKIWVGNGSNVAIEDTVINVLGYTPYNATNPNSYTSNLGTITSVGAGNGLDFISITTTGNVTLGTPSDISNTSTNNVSATSHTHNIDVGSIVGGNDGEMLYNDGDTIGGTSSMVYNDSTNTVTESVSIDNTNYYRTISTTKGYDTYNVNSFLEKIQIRNSDDFDNCTYTTYVVNEKTLKIDDDYGTGCIIDNFSSTMNYGVQVNSVDYITVDGINTRVVIHKHLLASTICASSFSTVGATATATLTVSSTATVTGTLNANGNLVADRRISAYQDIVSQISTTMDVSIGQNGILDMLANYTLTLNNLTNGDEGNIIIKQDVTGGHTLTITNAYVINGGGGSITLTSASNAIDIIHYRYADSKLFIELQANYTN